MIENMQPGRELDLLVMQHVTHYQPLSTAVCPDGTFDCHIPKYSTTWEGMRLVVEEMIRRGAEINIGYYFMWDCSIDYKGTNYSYASENAPHATCIAALRALKEDTNE